MRQMRRTLIRRRLDQTACDDFPLGIIAVQADATADAAAVEPDAVSPVSLSTPFTPPGFTPCRHSCLHFTVEP